MMHFRETRRTRPYPAAFSLTAFCPTAFCPTAICLAALAFVLLPALAARAQDTPTPLEPQAAETTDPADPTDPATEQPAAEPRELPGLIRISRDDEVWLDPKRKLVVVDGYIALRQGQLEMFACPKGTKEHESVVAVNAKPSFIHAGLLAIGAEPGRPVQFDPEYAPATGPRIEVLVLWKDAEGKKHQVRAQEWLKHVKSGEVMKEDWVFAGSGFWVEQATGKQYYHADGGDFICVSNFPTATLDIPVASSQENANLMFEAFTERIPPLKTKVRLVLYPLTDKPKQVGASAASGTAPAPTDEASTEEAE